MLTLNYRDARPIYVQIRDGLKQMIVTGAFAPGEKLPSVRALAVDLAINPNTIQRAYEELEALGLICSVPGKGSFVSGAPAEEQPARKEALLDRLRELLAELRYCHVTDEEIDAVIKEGRKA